jgi:hypothetical protein
VATGPVRSDGTFALAFTPLSIPGQYPAVARQTTPSGPRQASTGITILPNDSRTSPSHPTTAPPTSHPAGTLAPVDPTLTASGNRNAPPPAGIPTSATASAGTSGGSSPWWWIAILVLLAGASGTVVLLRRRKHAPTDPPSSVSSGNDGS